MRHCRSRRTVKNRNSILQAKRGTGGSECPKTKTPGPGLAVSLVPTHPFRTLECVPLWITRWGFRQLSWLALCTLLPSSSLSTYQQGTSSFWDCSPMRETPALAPESAHRNRNHHESHEPPSSYKYYVVFSPGDQPQSKSASQLSRPSTQSSRFLFSFGCSSLVCLTPSPPSK